MTSTPFKQAMEIYSREFCKRTFLEDFTLHLTHGYVISLPDRFLMGRPVRKDATYEQLIDITHRFNEPDAWFVWAAAGCHPYHLLKSLPFNLQFIGWERRNRPRFYKLIDLQLHAIRHAPFQAI